MKRAPYILGIICTTALAGMVPAPAFADTDSQAEIAALKAEIQKEHLIIQKLMAKVDQLQTQQNQQASKGDHSPEQAGGRTSESRQAVAASPDLHDWSGPYAGANVGAGMTSGQIEDKDFSMASDSFSNGLVQGGIHAGYNHQTDNTVLGVEGEVNLGSQDHKGHFNGGNPFATTSQVDWSAAILGRAGVAVGNTLVFVDAGPAIARVKGSAIGQQASAGVNADVYSWSPGIKGGAGVEFFVTPTISVRAQYSILDVMARSANIRGCPPGAPCRSTWTNMQQTATIGADWHF